MIKQLRDGLDRWVHRTPYVVDFAYWFLRAMNPIWRRLPGRPSSMVKGSDGFYPMNLSGMGTWNITTCNARCTFCSYPVVTDPRETMPLETFEKGIKDWKALGGTGVHLTPTIGEIFLDKHWFQRCCMIRDLGMTSAFITNGILLKRLPVTKLFDAHVDDIGISLASFDRQIYKEVYGIDRADDVFEGVKQLLEENKKRGEPISIGLGFRNVERPGKILRSPRFAEIRPYLSKKVRVQFMLWTDDWSGLVKTKLPGMHYRKLQQKNLPCKGLQNMNIATDGSIRLCGCRPMRGDPDFVIGTVDEGFKAARERATKIIDGFYKGEKPKYCNTCNAYEAWR